MFGENLGTGSLIESLRSYIEYTRIDYESGDHAAAERNAKALTQGAMVLWERMAELRRGGEGDEA